jgi:hypothetical protein
MLIVIGDHAMIFFRSGWVTQLCGSGLHTTVSQGTLHYESGQRKLNNEQSYWWRAENWSWGLYTKSRDQSMLNWLNTYVAPFWHQIFLVQAKQNTPYNYWNQTPLLKPRCTLIKYVFKSNSTFNMELVGSKLSWSSLLV